MDDLLVYAVSFLSAAVPRQTTSSLHALVHRLDRHLVKGRVYLLLRGSSSHWVWWGDRPFKHLSIGSLGITTRSVSNLCTHKVFVPGVGPVILMGCELVLRKGSWLLRTTLVRAILSVGAEGLFQRSFTGPTLGIRNTRSCCMLRQRTCIAFDSRLEVGSCLISLTLVLLTVQSIGLFLVTLVSIGPSWVVRIAVSLSHWGRNDSLARHGVDFVADQGIVVDFLDHLIFVFIIILVLFSQVKRVSIRLSISYIAWWSWAGEHLLLLLFELGRVFDFLRFVVVKLVFFVSV